ncbi:hypothetical protein [Streptomyces sp. SID9727]|uniref:hypothetical protein n=1 Tax=Streptomyces sp. SID9727 TaxID=2706114 RepID=UPI0013CD2890|nr:hypothetical protein [Streptomyces sp. SID9727]NEC66205.1 hypothetical protein [Streptomyces sp. SID9727]
MIRNVLGAVLALAGAAAAVLSPFRDWYDGRLGRRRRRAPESAAPDSAPDTWPPTWEPGPSVQTSPWPEPEGDDPYLGPDPARPPGEHPGPSGG